jgi:tetratricopeptide (TPR) repeat protein
LLKKSMHKGRLIIILSLAVYNLAAQHSLPEVIREKYAGMAHDSIYVKNLNQEASDFLRSNPGISRLICNHALEVASEIKFTRGYARALTIMGNTYWYEGIYEFAQNYYLLAARQYQSIHDSIGLGQTYNNIGEVYKKLNENNKALEYLLKSKELKKSDSSTRAITLYNIGELLIRLDKLDEAKKYITESFDFARSENNIRVMAFDYWTLAAMKIKEKDYEAAIAYFIDAEKIWKQMGETRSLIQTYQDMAEVFLQQRKYDKAEQYLKMAMNLAKQIKVPDLQVNNYLRYSKLDSIRGNYRQSLHYMLKYNALKDSVYNLLKAEQIARLQTIYESEGREQENKALRVEKELKDAELASQRITLIAISAGLIIAGILAWMLYQQQKKILFQKEAIEMQAGALLKLNEELQEFNRGLEARISERTSQLTVQNQRLAEFTFINAHKLRAPVASILGLINLLQQSDTHERDLILTHLRTCGEQLDGIIHEVSRNLEDAIVRDSDDKKV